MWATVWWHAYGRWAERSPDGARELGRFAVSAFAVLLAFATLCAALYFLWPFAWP